MSPETRPPAGGRVVLVRGGGDLGSGVILRLYRSGFRVVVTELCQPLVVRRSVSFAEAVYAGLTAVEGVTAELVASEAQTRAGLMSGRIPVLVDAEAACREWLQPEILVDARLNKKPPELSHPAAPFVVGLGPGFTAGINCHAVVETKRGHTLGRVYWKGAAESDTGIPEQVESRQSERVLRAPLSGRLRNLARIGQLLQQGEEIAAVGEEVIVAPFGGLLRGLLADGLDVQAGMKVGDIDPRNDRSLIELVSDKALAVGGGVLEAVLSWESSRMASR